MRLEPIQTDAQAVSASSLPLQQESIRIRIDQQYATTEVTQTYKNLSKSSLEGICSIRAGLGAVVQGFAYYNGATKIVGEVFEKETARQVYEQTTGLRRDPGLLEETGTGAFSFRVFPVAAGEQKRIEVTLGQRLSRQGRHVQYRLPLGSAESRVSVQLLDSRRLDNIASSSHKIAVLPQPSGGYEIVATPNGAPKELLLDYDIDEAPGTLSASIHKDMGQNAYVNISMATAEVPVARDAKDVTIVLDHSGSMSGKPLDEARAAAKEIVSKLTPKDRLNIISFDDQADSLFGQMEPVTTKSRDSALAYLDRVQSGGGTDLALALRRAIGTQRPAATRPIVLFLTDGESEAASVFSAAKQDNSELRIFTVGIGPGVNQALLSQLADLKRGRFTYIQSAEAIRDSVARIFRLVETPVITAPTLQLEGGSMVQMHPQTLPDLSPGEELVVSARIVGTGKMRLKLKGKERGRDRVHEVAFELAESSKRPWVGRLWAQARVGRVLEDIALQGETEERKNEAIELALSYGLVTKYTSFLAIPESEVVGDSKELLGDARAQKRAILARRPDAVALSRSEMPPGDPVLSVRTAPDALRVTAFFPFGLEKELKFDPESGLFRVRFLVPNTVVDGRYDVPVLVVHRDGHGELLTASYVIDSHEPEFEVETECRGEWMILKVTTGTPMREVRAASVSNPTRRVLLSLDPHDRSRTRYQGRIRLKQTSDSVRIVVTDMARNEGEEVVRCTARN